MMTQRFPLKSKKRLSGSPPLQCQQSDSVDVYRQRAWAEMVYRLHRGSDRGRQVPDVRRDWPFCQVRGRRVHAPSGGLPHGDHGGGQGAQTAHSRVDPDIPFRSRAPIQQI